MFRDRGGSAPFMHTLGLRSALACAAVGLGVLALPQGAAGQRAYVPDEVVVGIDGEAPRVHRLAPGTTVGEAIAALERDPAVEFAQPNWIARASLTPLDRGTPGTPGGWAADQWSFLGKPGGIRVARAWDRLIAAGAPGGAGTIVAVVDTGIAHVASAGGFVPSPDFAPGQFVPGIDIVDDDSVAVDENGHGTHVAGTIAEQVTLDQPAAVTDYLTGIAYGARLMPVRVLDRSGAGSATDVGEGILWAARNGADVINVSLQFDAAVTGCEQVPTVCAATREARRLGAFVVAAAGNAVSGKGERRALFPGAAPGVFAVGATTEHGCLAIYSTFAIARTCSRPGRTAAAGRRAPGLRGRSAARAAAELRLLPGLRVGLGSLQHPPRPRNLDVGRAHERGRGPGSRQRRAEPIRRRSASPSGSPAPPAPVRPALLRAGVARRPARDRPGRRCARR